MEICRRTNTHFWEKEAQLNSSIKENDCFKEMFECPGRRIPVGFVWDSIIFVSIFGLSHEECLTIRYGRDDTPLEL